MSVKKGDVYYIELKTNIGSVQAGTRPVVIIQNDVGNFYSPTTIVACITSQMKKTSQPTHTTITQQHIKQGTPGQVLCEQILTINKTDLLRQIGTLTETELLALNEALKTSLNLN